MTQSRTHQRPPKDSRNRLRQAGLLRTVAKRSRSDWPLVLAAWMLLACATTLITAAATYSESVAVGGYHRTIEASPAASSAVRTYSNLKSTDLPVADAALARPARPEASGGLRLMIRQERAKLSPGSRD